MTKNTTKLNTTKLEAADVCVCLHAALRKHCDSAATSAAYQVIHLMEFPDHIDPWRLLGEIIAPRLSQGGNPARVLKASVESLEDKWYEKQREAERDGLKVPHRAMSAMYALVCVFRCFSEQDWIDASTLLEA